MLMDGPLVLGPGVTREVTVTVMGLEVVVTALASVAIAVKL